MAAGPSWDEGPLDVLPATFHCGFGRLLLIADSWMEIHQSNFCKGPFFGHEM